jgi:hypothetical protein
MQDGTQLASVRALIRDDSPRGAAAKPSPCEAAGTALGVLPLLPAPGVWTLSESLADGAVLACETPAGSIAGSLQSLVDRVSREAGFTLRTVIVVGGSGGLAADLNRLGDTLAP